MPFHVRDRETDSLVRELAGKQGIGLTEAVRLGVLRAQVLKRPATGQKADKAFFDDLSGEPFCQASPDAPRRIRDGRDPDERGGWRHPGRSQAPLKQRCRHV